MGEQSTILEAGFTSVSDRTSHRIRARLAAWVGTLDYWRHPEWRQSWGGPFNGQAFRQRIFSELYSRLPLAAIVETGTYRGTTTEYFRRATSVPVHSFERVPRHYGFARARLRFAPDVHLHRSNSVAGLAELASRLVLPPAPVFFYLDAHGDGDLPLADEVDLVFKHWKRAIVMIDDFAVPDDPGYGFDDYGPGQALTLDYLGVRVTPPTAIWFPACASTAETGERRGCIVLARDTEVIPRIDAMATLRRWACTVK